MPSDQEQDTVEFRCGVCGQQLTGPLGQDTARRIGEHQAGHIQWGDRAGE